MRCSGRRWAKRAMLSPAVGPSAEGRGGVGERHDGATVVCRGGRCTWCSGWRRAPRQKGHGGGVGVRHEHYGGALRGMARISSWLTSNSSASRWGGGVSRQWCECGRHNSVMGRRRQRVETMQCMS